MAGVMGEPVKTFTIGFDDRDGFDERPFARAVADRFATEHHEEVVHPEAVELVERLVWHHDQPFGDSSAVPTFLLNQVARSTSPSRCQATAATSCSPVTSASPRASLPIACSPAPRGRHGGGGSRALPSAPSRTRRAPPAFRLAIDEGMPSAYLGWISYVAGPARAPARAPDDWAQETTRTPVGSDRGRQPARPVAGAEHRDLSARRPAGQDGPHEHGPRPRGSLSVPGYRPGRVRDPPAPGAEGPRASLKRVLKRAVADLLPDEILTRPKRGFGVPLDRWFRGDLARTRQRCWAQGSVRRRLNGADSTGCSPSTTRVPDHGHALWTLLTLELFLRRHGW